jgi:hypothetical protein
VFFVGVFGIILVVCPGTAIALVWYDWPDRIVANLIVFALQLPAIGCLLWLLDYTLTTTDLQDDRFNGGVVRVLFTAALAIGSLLFSLWWRWPKQTQTVVAAAGLALMAAEAAKAYEKQRDEERAKAVADELERRHER